MFYVYLIKCKNFNSLKESYYCGYTNNPERRKKEHFNPNNKNGAKYCKTHTPLEMKIVASFRNRRLVMALERVIKKKSHNYKRDLFESGSVVL